jgi:dihydroorotate dehydrogenase
MSYRLMRPLLFTLNAEFSHDLALHGLAAVGRSKVLQAMLPAAVADPVEKIGLRFANRVGLAAGLDKNARCVKGMAALGFGFIEVGTVTPLPQAGNPKPRLFRLAEHEAIINRMGFNNDGLEALVARIRQLRAQGLAVPLGINIGKNKATPQAQSSNDYIQCLEAVAEYADYVTINLSSPNTPGLRDLQFGDSLDALMQPIARSRMQLADKLGKCVPVLVKIAPDMQRDELLTVADRLQHFGIDGIIATNTTVDRSNIENHPLAHESGGLSGKVLFEQSTATLVALAEHLQGAMLLVGVGGINSASDAVAKIRAGADLVQIYSGLIYQGPKLVADAAAAIAKQHTA